ncbi:metallophosphoesterase [Lutibacter holmesii]|uniref:Metallophosphoesterase n=1 Tax=Lutibacter holmesii TaxID=1137985 RepID=A0ABW3WJE7_9FLAO
MSRNRIYKLLFFILSFLLVSCANYKKQYSDVVSLKNTENHEYNEEIDHTFYLIGDAGNAKMGEPLQHFNLLKKELSNAASNATVLFLGDNLYEKGMPKKSHPERALAEHRLNVQIELVKDFKGQPIFIPGNHDYYTNGITGLKREENYIEKHLGKNSFLPKNGCPITKVDVSENVVLIVIDSQWYLENWDKNPTMNNDCDIKTRDQFFYEYERLIKKNTLKTTLVAIHHPMFSYGSHGGQFSLKAQLYPTGGTFPLPIIGSFLNVLRKTSGISTQDMINPYYQHLRKRLLTISQKQENIIFVSGHEHNLQYILQDQIPQIISGSGSKTAPARVIEDSQFSYGGLGYAKFVTYKNGASWVYYYTENNGKKELLFKTEIQTKKETLIAENYNSNFPNSISASVYSTKHTNKSKAFVNFWGDHYRKYYSTNINAATASLDTLFGGLYPVRKGGGNQSRSLRLETSTGQEYVMRALHKSATQYLQAVAFKDHYIKGEYNNTFTESLLLDIYTTAHPYAPLTIAKLAKAANILYTNSQLFYIPKQPSLEQFNLNFGNELYYIEERAASGHGDKENFEYANTIISTDEFYENLRKSDDYYLDEATYIRARLFDMLIGDWDRHQDQWRWAEFKTGHKKMYKPVPRDRDQAFSIYDGFALGAITRLIPGLKLLQIYDDDIRNVKWFNHEPFPIDLSLIQNASYDDWKKQVTFLQNNITNEIIEEALAQMPSEVQDETVEEIKRKLKGRLSNLNKIAKEYYKHLAKYPIIRGNDKDNYFEITRLKNGETEISIYNIKKKKKGTLFFKKTYSNKETKEIWIYGLDESDTFVVTGENRNSIPLKIVGGQNNDIYNIQSGKKVTIYDFKSKKNTFKTEEGKKRLFDDYSMNLYSYKKYKHHLNKVKPNLGVNPDDGLKLGVINELTVYGFERNPFSQQHIIGLGYYFATNGYNLSYSGEFAHIFNKWNVLVEALITSPNFTRNFYGYGNESVNFDEFFGKDYHRVRISNYSVAPSLKWVGRMGSQFKLGATFESIEIEKTNNRFINTLPVFNEKRHNYLGIRASYFYENFNKTTFPTLGMAVGLEIGWKRNMNTNTAENNAYITPAIGFNYNITSNEKLVLATKFKGNIIIGDEFKFYNAASIGGVDGLRGYNNNRFTGNISYYNNTDIRYKLTKIKTKIVPFQIGLFGGFDYGRVWYKGEDSSDWKTSYGGGIWGDTAQLINFNLAVFGAKEGANVRFGIGFEF